MRKLIYIFCLLALVLGSCTQSKTYKIGVSQCSDDDWRSKMNDEIQRELIFHPDAEVEIRSAGDNNSKQIDDIRYFADNGFDIIIAAPNEADAITPVIKEVYGKGIPVVLFDRGIHGDTFTAYQGADNVAIATSAAKYAASLVPAGSKVIEIFGLPGSTPAEERHKGFADELPKHSISLVASANGDWNYDDGYRVADSLLNIYPDVDLIYAHNDRMAIAARNASKNHGVSPKIIGVDAAPEIGMKAVADGVIDATFLYPTEGQQLVRTALAILKGQPYEKKLIFPSASAVDLSNADILLLQNSELKDETNKVKILKGRVDDYWEKHSAQTTLFYVAIAFAALLCGFLFLLLRVIWQRKKNQKMLEDQNRLLEERNRMQTQLNEQLEVNTQTKLVFFTNVSHDLRTPLTLISAPVSQLSRAENLTPDQRGLLSIADRNVKILRRLINQILDFRKYENGKLSLQLSEVDFSILVEEWASGFRQLARSRDITFGLRRLPEGDTAPALLAIDTEKIERVFFNLVSNAFKYTPDNGNIEIIWSLEDGELKFSVIDSGKGISDTDLQHIFERFFRVDEVRHDGSGIGLSLAKAMVELHGGTISAKSELGKGSTFTVQLPVKHVEEAESIESHPAESLSERLSDFSEIIDNTIDNSASAVAEEEDDAKPLVLVIDDNADMRRLLATILSADYRVISAPDGKSGLRLAARYTPDLIICDVMMPVMDGLECCRHIKAEISTSHIPVLMLTACSLDEQRCRGYESGADGYIAKPFSEEMLSARCRSLIENRRIIRELWNGKQPISSPSPAQKGNSKTKAPAPEGSAVAGSDIDDEFYKRFIELFTSQMDDADLSVDTLAADLGLGRSQFYRKIKQLTNYSPVELMRKIRLTHARELLSKSQRSVSEIAYEVGFSTPAYFTKCFREAYGETPSELRQRLGIKA